jgi:hypothetical protein
LKKTTGKDGKVRPAKPRQPQKEPTPPKPSSKPIEHTNTPALLKGQEDKVIDQQMLDVKKAVERLVQYAVGCNKAPQVIDGLRDHLHNLERWAAGKRSGSAIALEIQRPHAPSNEGGRDG